MGVFLGDFGRGLGELVWKFWRFLEILGKFGFFFWGRSRGRAQEICHATFRDCKSLESLSLPKSLKYIQSYVPGRSFGRWSFFCF